MPRNTRQPRLAGRPPRGSPRARPSGLPGLTTRQDDRLAAFPPPQPASRPAQPPRPSSSPS
eukprot:12181837-Heterocapsa_arctica.AAC.1